MFSHKSLLKKKVVKDFLAVSLIDISLKPIAIIKGFIVANVLGPADFGLLKSIELIQKLNKYGNLGFMYAVKREAAHFIGAGELEKAQIVRNTAFTLEFILSLFLFIIGISCTLFSSSKEIDILIILASSGLLLSKLNGIQLAEAVIQKKFILISKIALFATIINDIIVIFTVPFLKIYSILITDLVVCTISVSYYFFIEKYRFSMRVNFAEVIKICSISIPLTIGTLAQGAFEYSERILLIKYLGKIALGYFGFGAMVAGNILLLLKNSIRVREQDIFQLLGQKAYQRIHRIVIRETLLFTFASILMIAIFWFPIQYFIQWFMPKWRDAIVISQMYIFIIPFQLVINYPSAVLISSVVNKQNILPGFRFISAGFLITGTIGIAHFNMLSLHNFIIINIISYGFYSVSVIVLYFKYFYYPYIRLKHVIVI